MRKPRFLSVLVSLAACGMLATLVALLGPTAPNASAAATDLFISEYVEGSSTNKVLEIFNGTAGPVVLDGVYDIQIYANGSATTTATILLTGTIEAGGTFVLARAGSATELIARADQTTGNFLFSNGCRRRHEKHPARAQRAN